MTFAKQINTTQEKKEIRNKSFFELFETPFFAMTSSLRKLRMDLSKNAMMVHEYLLEQFANPTHRNRSYIHISFEELEEEFKDRIKRSSLYKALDEIEAIESGFLTYDLGRNKGKFYFINNSENRKLFEDIQNQKIRLVLDKTFKAIKVDNLIKLNVDLKSTTGDFSLKTWISNPELETSNPQFWISNPELETTEGGKKQPLTLNWSSLESDLENITKEVNKEVYKESYHKEVSFLSPKVDTQAILKNEMMNDDVNIKIEKKEEDKISNFYLSEMIDLGIYESTAKKYLLKLSTDDIQKAFDKLEAAKDSGHYIKNEGNFIRETLEAMIDPNFKPKFSIQEKESEVLNIPAPIKKVEINAREKALNNALSLLMPNFNLVIHQASTKEGDLLRLLLSKFQYCIQETSTEWEDINQIRQDFTEKMKTIKSNPDNHIKEIFLDDYSNPFANKKNEDGKKVYDLFLEWFEGI